MERRVGAIGARVRLSALLLAALAVGVVLWTLMALSADGAIAVGSSPMAVAIDAATGRAFVLSQATANERVSVLDTAGRRVVQTIEWPWGLKPTSGLPSPNAVAIDGRSGRAFVTDANTDSINVLDMWSGRVLKRVAAPWSPNAVAIASQTARVFIVGGRVAMLDARTGAPLREIPIGGDAVAVDTRVARVFIAE